MNALPQSGGCAPACVADAIVSACVAELGALKPGNVSVHSEGHGMNVDDFVRSAYASAPQLACPGLSVGDRILRAIRATRRVVNCNTNLGIVLLCAPLAQAALSRWHRQSLRSALAQVLQALDEQDARMAYEAIRLASPAGLGDVEQYDVRRLEPAVSLLQAMHAAAGRDRIAQQYVSDYADIFDLALPRFYDGMKRWNNEEWAAVSVYLCVLGSFPDTHIERKYGAHLARLVSEEAKRLDDMLLREAETPQRVVAPLLRFDAELKRKGINPGTSADLTVAALAVARLQNCLQGAGQAPFHGREAAQVAVPLPFLTVT